MNAKFKTFLLNAESKVLATIDDSGPNAVPVSTIFVKDGKIILVDYFMEKTVDNILGTSSVSLVAWTGMEGFQIQGFAGYHVRGKLFQEIERLVKESLPERTVKGVIEISPVKIYDISPSRNSRDVLGID